MNNTNQKKMAIIGANEMQLPLVLKAKDMGIKTVCFAWKEGAVCKKFCDKYYPISILDKELILKKCIKENIGAITSIATDTAVPTVSYVADNMGLISNSYQYSDMCTNKYYMRKQFLKHNVGSPDFFSVGLNKKINVENMQFPLIVKPVDRSGSRGVIKVENEEELLEALKVTCSISFVRKSIIEEYIEGKEVSVESISWNGHHYIIAITDKETSQKPFFVELAHHQPTQLENHIQHKIKKETIKALNSLHIKYGASHTEIKITSSGAVYLIEVGARMGGDFIGSDLVELSTGYDFIKGVIEIAFGYFNKPVLNQDNYAGIYFISEQTKYLLKYFNKSKHFSIKKKKITGNKICTPTNSTERSGYIIYQAIDKVYL